MSAPGILASACRDPAGSKPSSRPRTPIPCSCRLRCIAICVDAALSLELGCRRNQLLLPREGAACHKAGLVPICDSTSINNSTAAAAAEQQPISCMQVLISGEKIHEQGITVGRYARTAGNLLVRPCMFTPQISGKRHCKLQCMCRLETEAAAGLRRLGASCQLWWSPQTWGSAKRWQTISSHRLPCDYGN